MFNFFKLLLIICLTLSSLFSEELQERTSWGIELNPLSFTMLGTGSDTKIFSGVVSRFNQNDATELALSFVYAKNADIFTGFYSNNYTSKVSNLTLHYRKFVSHRTKGFYYGGFGSYTYLDGKLQNDNRFATVTKVGLGAEIGVRNMKTDTDWSFYWGPALRMGGYFGSNNDIFYGNNLGFGLYDRQFFIDVDFMRIGFRF